jgi:hypothetical protein
MNINPMVLMQLKSELDSFKGRHPKLELFFNDALNRMDSGSVIEISLTTSSGEKIRTNMKVTPEDKQLLEKLNCMK